MAFFQSKRNAFLHFFFELIMIACIVSLIGWYYQNKAPLWELSIASDPKMEEIAVTNYREFQAAFFNPNIKVIHVSADIVRDDPDATIQHTLGIGPLTPKYDVALALSRDLHVFGHSHSLKALSEGRFIEVLSGGNLRVEDLSFMDAIVSDDTLAQGGAIRVHPGASAHFERCSFQNNATYSHLGRAEGGAVFGDAEFFLCTFTLNSANGKEAFGGASSGGRFDRSDFKNNEARSPVEGGISRGGATHEGIFTDTLFNGNKSIAETNAYGGAGHLGSYTNCLFTGNSVESDRQNAYGGALSEATVANSTFVGNAAIANAKTSAQGGASWKGTFTNCTFTQNNVSHKEAPNKNPSEVPLAIASADAEQAKLQGGGVYGGVFTNCIIVGNAAIQNDVFGRDAATANSFGGNVVGEASLSHFDLARSDYVGARAADVFGSNRLADNGGFVQTIAIPRTSLAIKRGVLAPSVPEQDARGVARTKLFSDAGAFELSSTLPLTEATPPEDAEKSILTAVSYEWKVGVAIPPIAVTSPNAVPSPNSPDIEAKSEGSFQKILTDSGRFFNRLFKGSKDSTFQVSGLPQGITFEAETNEIKGTPTEAREGIFEIKEFRKKELFKAQEFRYRVLP